MTDNITSIEGYKTKEDEDFKKVASALVERAQVLKMAHSALTSFGFTDQQIEDFCLMPAMVPTFYTNGVE